MRKIIVFLFFEKEIAGQHEHTLIDSKTDAGTCLCDFAQCLGTSELGNMNARMRTSVKHDPRNTKSFELSDIDTQTLDVVSISAFETRSKIF